MSAPDFYFVNNAMFRHIHDRFGMPALIQYWRELGAEYYRRRALTWRESSMEVIADDWRKFFAEEPQADVQITSSENTVELDIRICPAIKHLRDNGRDIVPYFCDHCDHITSAMAELANCTFERTGGMGSCQQRITRLTVSGKGI